MVVIVLMYVVGYILEDIQLFVSILNYTSADILTFPSMNFVFYLDHRNEWLNLHTGAHYRYYS